MAETLPASRKPTARSGAIYTSADLLSKLIESEIAHATKPYQNALDALQRKLQAQNKASVDQSTAVELCALKAALEDSGLALVQSDAGGRPTLDFIGESGKLLALLSSGMKRLSPDEGLPPITPATIVKVLVEGFADYQRQIEEAHKQHPGVLATNIDLKKQLDQRDAAAKAEAVRRDAERTQLEGEVLEKQKKVSALTNAVTALRDQTQSLTVGIVSARAESKDWKAKHHAVETERDALKLSFNATEGDLASSRSDLDLWKSKCLAAQADLKTLRDGERNLRALQAEGEKWRTKCLQLEADLKTATEEKEKGLANAQLEMNKLTAKGLANIANVKKTMEGIKNARDESNEKLRASRAEVDEWKRKFLLAQANLNVAEDEKNSLANLQTSLQKDKTKLEEDLKAAKTELADWTAKAVAWDTERKQRESQTIPTSTLISQPRSEVPELRTKLQEVEMERDSLKAAQEADNALALANNNLLMAELEDLRKKHNPVVATGAPKTSSSMFIKSRQAPARTGLPDKPSQMPPPIASQHPSTPIIAVPIAPRRTASSPSATATTSKAPDQSSSPSSTPTPALGRVVGLNGRVSVRNNATVSSSSPISSPVTSSAPRPPVSAAGFNSKTVDPRKPPQPVQSSPALPPPIFAGDNSDVASLDVLGTAPGLSRLGGISSRQSNFPSMSPAASSAAGSNSKPKSAVDPRKRPQRTQSSSVVPLPIVAADSSVRADFDALGTTPGLERSRQSNSNSPSTSTAVSSVSSGSGQSKASARTPAPSKTSKPPSSKPSSSKRSAEDGPESTSPVKKRAPLASQSTSYAKSMPEYQESVDAFEGFDQRRTKRPAPSPLVSERVKVPRVETLPEKSKAAKLDNTPSNPRQIAPSSRGSPSTFSRAPTVIPTPVTPRSARQKASQRP
ncbi:hypothetical protein MSAN_01566200 [Mycena sanguinolenta]|uniref:Uncharacterized protein n=1 Tax=Mycena sanguinolenta TaxID=230812 RepID=A0A8H6Y2A9_9AGAR|nr:hypothetical protein MSAN_01566200 [Mycena sanguinolenta]